MRRPAIAASQISAAPYYHADSTCICLSISVGCCARLVVRRAFGTRSAAVGRGRRLRRRSRLWLCHRGWAGWGGIAGRRRWRSVGLHRLRRVRHVWPAFGKFQIKVEIERPREFRATRGGDRHRWAIRALHAHQLANAVYCSAASCLANKRGA